MKFIISQAAVTEPVTLDQARQHLRLDTFGEPAIHEDDDLVEILITAARQWCEQYTQQALGEYEVTAVADEFPIGRIYLPFGPVLSVDSVYYYNTSGNAVLWAESNWDFDEFDDSIVLTYGNSYPNVQSGRNNAITITYTAGYNTENPMPKPIYQAMLLLIGHLYENRSSVDLNNLAEVPMGVTLLLQPYRTKLGI
jgi:uncharacterized phiE125 gp8 family phage protein